MIKVKISLELVRFSQLNRGFFTQVIKEEVNVISLYFQALNRVQLQVGGLSALSSVKHQKNHYQSGVHNTVKPHYTPNKEVYQGFTS